MSTSLAEQLRKLATPQSSLFVDSKKRDSILFNPKDAATKGRDTIYEIGLSGLEELIEINPVFSEFESTLFDRTAKDFERSVEVKEVNERLNNTIKRFMFQLSPYFMLQSSHKCLEWLIRRFHINTFNKDEFLMLILPYHETNTFVRCVQTMKFSDPNDKWSWLSQVAKAGVPLSKAAIFQHGASNSSFLEFIGKFTYEAVKELDSRAGTLQTIFAFYCTSIIGALEVAKKVSESHIVSIVGNIFKGFKSTVIDFAAASYMITAQLIVKAKLSQKLVNEMIVRIPNLIHPALTINVTMLLCLIFEKQEGDFQIDDKALDKILSSKWIPSALGEIKRDGSPIIEFYKALISNSLRKIQQQTEKSLSFKALCQNLINEVVLTNEEAEVVIKSVLDSYIFDRKKELPKKEDEVISLDSDDESEIVTDESVTIWYSEFLKNLERQYPSSFDCIVKQVLKGNQDLSDKKRNALKNVLGFLLKVSCSENDANVFEHLYHHNARLRSEAVKYLAKNFEKISVSSEGTELLKDTVTERLNDDNPDVVLQVLQFAPEKLIQLIGHDLLIQKLSKILVRCMKNPTKWQMICATALSILTSQSVWNCNDPNKVFLALFPFLYPIQSSENSNIKLILESDFSKSNEFFALLKGKFKKVSGLGSNEICSLVSNCLREKTGLPKTEDLLNTIEEIFRNHKNINSIHIYYNLLVLSASFDENLTVELSQKIFNLVFETLDLSKFEEYSEDGVPSSYVLRQNKIPGDLNFLVLGALIESTKFKETRMDLVNQSNETQLKLKLFKILIEKFYESQKSLQQKKYNQLINKFLGRVTKDAAGKLLFLSQFCVGYFVETDGISIEPDIQLRIMKIFVKFLEKSDTEAKHLNVEIFLNVLGSLMSEINVIRSCGIELMEILASEKIDASWKYFFTLLVARKEEILMDEEQISLILYTIMSDKKGKTVIEKNHLNQISSAILKCIEDNTTFEYYAALLLNLIKHLNDSKICQSVCGVAMKILENSKKTKDFKFNYYQSLILKLVILKLNKETIKNLSKELWQLIQKSLESHLLIYDPDGKYMTPSILAIDIFEEDVYDTLHADYQKELLSKVVKAATFSDHPIILSAAGKLFKRIEIEGKYLKIELERLFLNHEVPTKVRGGNQSLQIENDVLSSEKWKCGVTLLELLQNKKKKVDHMEELVAVQFQILQRSLKFQEQSKVEYTKQMIMSLLLQCCQKISPDGKEHRKLLPDSVFRIEAVMECIRETANPQTHHHALLLLSYLAIMIPEQVLHNMMTIFTFMGSSIVRHDDAYSFQIISKIIENVIPTLVKSDDGNIEKQVIPVLRIFSDIILDVPEHRRINLYVKLLSTLGASDFMWMFLAILMESHVNNHEKEKREKSKSKKRGDVDDTPRRLQIAKELIIEFDSKIIIDSCSKLILYLKDLPLMIEKTESNINLESLEKTIFSLQTHNDLQLRHFKYAILQFIDLLLSSIQVTNKIVSLDEESILALKPSYQNLILQILTYIPEVKKAVDNPKLKFEKSYRIMLQICFDTLQNAISLLTPDMLLVVVQNLMLYKYMNVRKKVLDLLITKLESNYFDDCSQQNILKLLDPLKEICESISCPSSKVIPSTATPQEIIDVQVFAAVAIKQLAKKFAADNVQEFKEILDVLTSLTENHTNIKINLLAHLVLCIAELTVELKVHSIGHLVKFMPTFLNLLTIQVPDNALIVLLHATVSSILKVVETLPLFLSPYIVKLTMKLAKITTNLKMGSGDSKVQNILQKIQAIWTAMAKLVPARVLIPAIDESYTKIIEKSNFRAVEPLMELMLQMFQHIQDFKSLQAEFSQFFLKALQFRGDQGAEEKMETDEIVCEFGDMNESEGYVIKAFVALILKLSESSFKPLYFSVYDWAIRNAENKERVITFYRLSNEIASALKSLFVLFASDLVSHAAEVLNELNLEKAGGVEGMFFGEDKEKNLYLLEHILKTLYNIFLHDRQNFINTHRFDILVQPITNQLENEIILGNEVLMSLVSDCLSQLAVAASDDILWKQLNYQILLKTRNNNPEIRMFALSVCIEVARKLGEDFQPLLPETIPFLAELLEDDNYKVEKSCQKAVQELEKILGEPLQKYF